MSLNSLDKQSKIFFPYKNAEIYYSLYEKYGFFILKNCFTKIIIKKIINEIKKAKGTNKYLDQNNLPRRIEKIYNKGVYLRYTNEVLLKILKEIFSEKFTIFKDKYNSKPPGGEGFFAHYDGIFQFKNKNNKLENGWYKYGNEFVNILVALDPCNKKNGTIEISKAHKNNFLFLLNKTKKDGTPNLESQKKLRYASISLNLGDLLIFKNTCPHRSKKNNSSKDRRTLYYTYTPLKYGSKYKEYFDDKEGSRNKTSKSLSAKT